MIKNKEEIIRENTDKISQIVKNYVEELDTLSETRSFTIDAIEKMWECLDNDTKVIYREIGQEIISQIDEREIIKSKKANIN